MEEVWLWNSPCLKPLKKYSFVNGKGLEWSFRFDAAVMFKYMHTDEADRVTDTLEQQFVF